MFLVYPILRTSPHCIPHSHTHPLLFSLQFYLRKKKKESHVEKAGFHYQQGGNKNQRNLIASASIRSQIRNPIWKESTDHQGLPLFSKLLKLFQYHLRKKMSLLCLALIQKRKNISPREKASLLKAPSFVSEGLIIRTDNEEHFA